MVRNYLKIVYRYLLKHKAYTFINVVGLAIGMAACLLIILFVQDERSYDRFYTHADDIYRVTHERFDDDGVPGLHAVLVDPLFAPLMKAEFPEVHEAVRLTPVGPSLSYNDQHIDSGDCYWADAELFEVFDLPFLAGDPETALREPYTLVLSASKARALFGDEEALGKTVVVNSEHAFTVTGVLDDLPANTHLPMDVVGSIATMESWFGPFGWDSPNYATYLLLDEQASPDQLEAKLADFLVQHRGEEMARTNQLHLQPLTDIHLRSHLVGELAPNSDVQYVYLLSAVAFFILFIACVNFMNLTTARATRRAKEVGLRKVTGANRSDLILQFLGESILLAFLSITLAVVMAELLQPVFNAFTGKTLGFQQHAFLDNLALFVGMGLVVGIAAGSYPAFYLSRFQPAVVLKGPANAGKSRSRLRSTLVVTQFVIAIILMLGTLVVYQQLSFVRNKQLGFDKEQMMVLPTVWDIKEQFGPFRDQLLQHPDVMDVAQSNPIPSRRLSFSLDANTQLPGRSELATTTLYPIFADAHFFPTYRIPFLAGRNFSDELASDTDTGFIVNETALENLGWATPEEAVGQPITVGGWRGTILGVVADFHFESLHQQIAPMVFYMDPRNYRMVSIRIRPGTDLTSLVAFLEDKWQQEEPDSPLSYTFLDQYFSAVYEAEQRLGKIFTASAILALIITCLGLFGMATFTVEQRRKEVGIRKVLGASVGNVVLLLTREFSVLVLLSFIVAAPMAYFALQRWLDGFAYHTELAWWFFALVGAVAFAVALLTVSFQSVRAALADPVKTLRYE